MNRWAHSMDAKDSLAVRSPPFRQHWPATPIGTKSATSLRFRSWRITRHSELLTNCASSSARSRILSRRTTHLGGPFKIRSEEHTSELQSQSNLVCRLLLDNK